MTIYENIWHEARDMTLTYDVKIQLNNENRSFLCNENLNVFIHSGDVIQSNSMTKAMDAARCVITSPRPDTQTPTQTMTSCRPHRQAFNAFTNTSPASKVRCGATQFMFNPTKIVLLWRKKSTRE